MKGLKEALAQMLTDFICSNYLPNKFKHSSGYAYCAVFAKPKIFVIKETFFNTVRHTDYSEFEMFGGRFS